MNRTVAIALVVAGCGMLSTACATTRAQTPTQRPALEVPPVPPRVIEPVLPPEPTTLEPVGELPPPTSTPPRPRPNPTRDKPTDAKPEAKSAETPAVDATPAPTTPSAQPVGPLRTPRTADGAKAEQQAREVINRANTLLARVDYQRLTPERQKAYNEAKQFVVGAEAAIKDTRFDLALELADKAETLAKELQQG
jgi:type IV secretory pathway VirB10-like protein